MSQCFPHDFVILVAAGDVTYNLHIYDVITSSLRTDEFWPNKAVNIIFSVVIKL